MTKSPQEEWDDERILMQAEGVKFDGDKLRYDLLPQNCWRRRRGC